MDKQTKIGLIVLLILLLLGINLFVFLSWKGIPVYVECKSSSEMAEIQGKPYLIKCSERNETLTCDLPNGEKLVIERLYTIGLS